MAGTHEIDDTERFGTRGSYLATEDDEAKLRKRSGWTGMYWFTANISPELPRAAASCRRTRLVDLGQKTSSKKNQGGAQEREKDESAS